MDFFLFSCVNDYIHKKRLATGVDPSSQSKFTISLLNPATP